MLVSGVQQSDSYIYIYIYIYIYTRTHLYIYMFFFRFVFIICYYKILNIVPCAIQLDLVVYFVYSNVYLLIPNS